MTAASSRGGGDDNDDAVAIREEFRDWFWSPCTWAHFGDLYMKTVDPTLAADA